MSEIRWCLFTIETRRFEERKNVYNRSNWKRPVWGASEDIIIGTSFSCTIFRRITVTMYGNGMFLMRIAFINARKSGILDQYSVYIVNKVFNYY